jgi:hypothetical protein
MGFPTKIQLIKRKESEQWYVNLPAAIAGAMDFGKSETVDWVIADRENLILHRHQAPPTQIDVKKKLGRDRSSKE